jgi:hypothetical protein
LKTKAWRRVMADSKRSSDAATEEHATVKGDIEIVAAQRAGTTEGETDFHSNSFPRIETLLHLGREGGVDRFLRISGWGRCRHAGEFSCTGESVRAGRIAR